MPFSPIISAIRPSTGRQATICNAAAFAATPIAALRAADAGDLTPLLAFAGHGRG
jgi:hypothetical protein